MSYVVIFVAGVILGFLAFEFLFKSKTVGDLRIDFSDPTDEPYMFLELHRNINDFYHKKYVTLGVNTESFISHK